METLPSCPTGRRGYPSHQAAWKTLTCGDAAARHPGATTYQCPVCRMIHIHATGFYREGAAPAHYLRPAQTRQFRREVQQVLAIQNSWNPAPLTAQTGPGLRGIRRKLPSAPPTPWFPLPLAAQVTLGHTQTRAQASPL